MAGLNPTSSGDSHNWNYTKPENPGFSLKLVGTVVAIQEVQAMKFGATGMPTTPDFWDDGNPKMNIRMVFAGPSGGFRTWTFQPAGRAAKEGKKKSVHIDLFNLAGGHEILDLIGKTIVIETVAPPAGFSYGVGKPRPWTVSLAPEGTGPYALSEPLEPIYQMARVLANGAVSGGTLNSPAASQAVANAAVQNMAPAVGNVPEPDPGEDIPF